MKVVWERLAEKVTCFLFDGRSLELRVFDRRQDLMGTGGALC